MANLENKCVLITGGTSGIGLAVAKNYLAAGANVIITGRRVEGSDIANKIGATFIACDATDEEAVKQSFATCKDLVGELDVLVVNAGTAFDEGSIESFDSEQMRQLMDINFNGVFYALKHGPACVVDGGSIITTGSAAGSGITHAGSAVYSASKAAVAYLSRASAIENAPRGIRVNIVCPALIAGTGMMTEDDGGDDARFLSKLTAMGRMGHQDEVVGIYNFLASDASSFISGQEIRVDGGLTAGIGLPIMDAIGSSL